ncbi:MAG: hypothetical protein RL662_1181 [Bacteroidota bacterium]|jgi:DNA-binding response OmpR family regulator
MRKQVLIVDDKESIAKVISVYLLEEYDVTYFENPLKAIAWMEGGNMPDLVLSDIHMPMMEGDEFLRYLKSNKLFSTIPFVILSAEDSSTSKIKLLELGADDYIVKPFNPVELKVRIKRILK